MRHFYVLCLALAILLPNHGFSQKNGGSAKATVTQPPGGGGTPPGPIYCSEPIK